jgi:hypothetical protein
MMLYPSPNELYFSPAFIKLMNEIVDRGMEFYLFRLGGDHPGMYLTLAGGSGESSLTIGDYEDGLQWSFWNGCHDQETELQPWVSLDGCMEMFDRVLLWDARKEDELFPGLKWLPQGRIIDK